MSITPMDILHKEFTKAFRGYSPEEVRDYLEQICSSLEGMLQERAQLLSEIESLKQNLERYHSIEDTLQSTLLLAQRTSDEAINNAHKQSKLIIEETRRQNTDVEGHFAQIKAQKEQFLLEFRTLLETYLKRVSEMSAKEPPQHAI
jgi:cell division initiation protein